MIQNTMIPGTRRARLYLMKWLGIFTLEAGGVDQKASALCLLDNAVQLAVSCRAEVNLDHLLGSYDLIGSPFSARRFHELGWIPRASNNFPEIQPRRARSMIACLTEGVRRCQFVTSSRSAASVQT
jgi:hypothetical protein